MMPWGKMLQSMSSTLSGWGGIIGANQLKGAEVIKYKPVDLQEEQKKSIAGNIAAEGDIEKLLAQQNTFQQGQAVSMMETALPGWGKLQKNLMDTTSALLTNPYDIPKEVQENLSRIAAERGITGGTRGQFNDFSLLKDLGINSLQYGQSRINQAQGLTGLLASTAPRVNPMSALAFYITPEQQAAEQRFTNVTEQEIAQGAANAKAALKNQKIQTMVNSWQQMNSELGQIWGGGDMGGMGGGGGGGTMAQQVGMGTGMGLGMGAMGSMSGMGGLGGAAGSMGGMLGNAFGMAGGVAMGSAGFGGGG